MPLPDGYEYDYTGNPMDPDIVPKNPTSQGSSNENDFPRRSILDYDGSLVSAMDILRTAIEKNDTATIDKIVDYVREDSLRREGYEREDTAYSRLAKDLKSVGINPIALMQGASPIASNYGYGSSGTGQYSSARQMAESKRHNKTSEALNVASIIVGILSTIIMFAALA